MGLSDRDYMRDRDSGVFRPTESSAIHWIWIVPLCVVVLLVTLGPPAWLPAKAIAAVQGVQRQLGFAVARSAEELQSGPGSGQVDQPIGATAIGAQQSLPTRQVVRRCLVNGVAVDVLNSECPPAVVDLVQPGIGQEAGAVHRVHRRA